MKTFVCEDRQSLTFRSSGYCESIKCCLRLVGLVVTSPDRIITGDTECGINTAYLPPVSIVYRFSPSLIRETVLRVRLFFVRLEVLLSTVVGIEQQNQRFEFILLFLFCNGYKIIYYAFLLLIGNINWTSNT